MTANNRTDGKFRVEEDALGNVEVPAEHLSGAQTQRSHLNFPIGVERYRWGRAVIRALGVLRKCAEWVRPEDTTHPLAPRSGQRGSVDPQTRTDHTGER